MLRAYTMYRPVQVFSRIAIVFFLLGAVTWIRFIYLYIVRGGVSGNIQSLIVGTGAIVLAFLVALVAILAELLAANRRLLEDLLVRVRRIESRPGEVGARDERRLEGIHSTGHAPWRPS